MGVEALQDGGPSLQWSGGWARKSLVGKGMGKLGWRVRMSKWEVCARGVVREAVRGLGMADDRVHGGS